MTLPPTTLRGGEGVYRMPCGGLSAWLSSAWGHTHPNKGATAKQVSPEIIVFVSLNTHAVVSLGFLGKPRVS